MILEVAQKFLKPKLSCFLMLCVLVRRSASEHANYVCYSQPDFEFRARCTVGWVNLYQKFEIEKYTVCGKLILPTGTTGMRICMDLRIFASFLYPTL